MSEKLEIDLKIDDSIDDIHIGDYHLCAKTKHLNFYFKGLNDFKQISSQDIYRIDTIM